MFQLRNHLNGHAIAKAIDSAKAPNLTPVSEPLSVELLNYSYKGLEVFKNFSIQTRSKIVVLRGPSGCGKTTLLKLLSGNLTPENVTHMPSVKGSCLVLQEDSLFPWLTGVENISKFTRIPQSEFSKHPMYELIGKFVDRKACRMSYGQRRMVELFRAISFRPPYLYLDEPFNFLDDDNMGLVVQHLQGESLKETTIVLSNHHHENSGMLSAAEIYKFDGTFPVTSLRRVN